MKKYIVVLISAVAGLTAGCANTDVGGMVGAGGAFFKAATLSDADVKTLSVQACDDADKKNKLAPANSKYSQRLGKIMAGLKNNDVPVEARVYLANEVNAWAMANGCVRVYSGLMDMMNDDEVRGVLGHEIGHVALGHTKKAMQVGYTTLAARGALAASGNSALATLSNSQLGELTESLINAQFSQSQESAADDYSLDLLKKNNANLSGLVSAFEKLAKLDGGDSSMFSSHPGSKDRAKRLQDKIAK